MFFVPRETQRTNTYLRKDWVAFRVLCRKSLNNNRTYAASLTKRRVGHRLSYPPHSLLNQRNNFVTRSTSITIEDGLTML